MRVAGKAEERVRREFFPEDYAAVMQSLTQWQTKEYAPGESPSRIHAAVLNLARGNIPDLREAIATVETDFRDALLWGEYSEHKHLWCVVCPANEGATLPEEEAFLKVIKANPPDNSARLVYADWLEERGDSRAAYLRLLCEWLTRRSAEDQALIEQERKLRADLSRRWLALIRGMSVREETSHSTPKRHQSRLRLSE